MSSQQTTTRSGGREPIAITGASGHLGSVLAKQLLDAGYPVRAVVRCRQRLADASWVSGARLDVVEADITDAAAMRGALAGIAGLFHVAAVFDVSSMPARELIANNVTGVETVMQAAAAQGVRRVVLTSSSAAVGTSWSSAEPRSEQDWNDATREPYALSKVLSERRAWALAAELGIHMIAVLPGALLGPGFNRLTPTLGLVKTALDNGFPMAPPIDFAFTDVRDIAAAHIGLYRSATAEGRYLACGATLSVLQLLAMIKRERPDTAIPREMPVWFARLFPAIDAVRHAVTKQPRQMRRGFVAEYVGRHHVLRSDRLRREIGWSPRAFESTLHDTIAWLEGQRFEIDERQAATARSR